MRKDKTATFEQDFHKQFGESDKAKEVAKWVKKYFTNTNVHTLSITNAVLLVTMFQSAKEKFEQCKDINVANKIDIGELGQRYRLKDGVIKQISICKYFGLVEQPSEWRNSGVWRLTDLGRAVAKSQATVSKYCTVVNGQVVTKSNEEVTLKEMFQTYTYKINKAIERKKKVNDEYYEFSRGYIKEY